MHELGIANYLNSKEAKMLRQRPFPKYVIH